MVFKKSAFLAVLGLVFLSAPAVQMRGLWL